VRCAPRWSGGFPRIRGSSIPRWRFTTRYPTLRSYLLGVLSMRLGDLAAAARYAAALAATSSRTSAEVRPFAHGLAESLRAHLALQRGDSAEALARLERGRVSGSEGLLETPFGSQAYERFSRAELLRQLGREREALGWYASVAGVSVDQLVYLGPAHLRQAETYESLGQPDEAAEHYRRLVGLWQECDPELRPIVKDAERRLARLPSGGK